MADAAEVAQTYTAYSGRSRRAMETMVRESVLQYERLADRMASTHALSLAVTNLGEKSLWADEPPASDARERWRSPAVFRYAAGLVARYGAGLCLEASCHRAVARHGSLV
jgi:hypothetical protein